MDLTALVPPQPTPYTLHPTPHTLQPTLYTLHPTPFNLHPTPYTLHPTPDERMERLDEGAEEEGVDEDHVPALHRGGVEVAEELFGGKM